MALLPEIADVLSGKAQRCAITSIPYGVFLGVEIERNSRGDGLQLVMPFHDRLIGTPEPPRLHGGTIGALLEFAGAIAVTIAAADASAQPLRSIPKPIGLTIEYMRGGAPDDVYASAEVLRLGRRIANVRAVAWQGDRAKPNASGTMHFLMPGAQD